jgi:lipopolysaccharide transport system ATP-binding protein
MSSEIAIRVENLSKCYQIYEKPQDRLLQMFFRGRKQLFREFWALKDVNLNVNKGECLGIIGRNGSGKSTLLQMICGTLNPTAGSIHVNGRVAALLELGSGFNPEFTGRENVYMNASILGLTTTEIDEKFASIIEFADIGIFIDQPVKTYSSGMMVRLAFAVIAHVDADILIIDEALAVGDAVFTQKCMRFIRAFKEKNTLLFVSHDMGAVKNLCDRVLWIDQGVPKTLGPSSDVIKDYVEFNYQKISGDEIVLTSKRNKAKSKTNNFANYEVRIVTQDNLEQADGFGTGLAKLESVSLRKSDEDVEQTVFNGGELVKLCVTASTTVDLHEPIIGFIVRDRLGQDLFGENTLVLTNERGLVFCGVNDMLYAEFTFRLPMLPAGKYSMVLSVAEGTQMNHIQHDWLHDSLFFDVIASNVTRGLVGVEFIDIDLGAKRISKEKLHEI